jgi:hypothetical protein
MSGDQQELKVEHRFKLEKRNDVGELYEVVEVAADERGRVKTAKVTHRKPGLAPPEAYAPIPHEE